jgi:hypothetical protein
VTGQIIKPETPRWNRLAADLTAAGIEATVDQARGGVNHSISLRLPSGDRVEIHDKWWRKNADRWLGWEVHTEDREGIVTRVWTRTMKRPEVVAAVRVAVDTSRR